MVLLESLTKSCLVIIRTATIQIGFIDIWNSNKPLDESFSRDIINHGKLGRIELDVIRSTM